MPLVTSIAFERVKFSGKWSIQVGRSFIAEASLGGSSCPVAYGTTFAGSAQPVLEPVADVIGPDLPVVGLTMLEAARFTIEDLQRLVVRARGGVELVGDFARRELVL